MNVRLAATNGDRVSRQDKRCNVKIDFYSAAIDRIQSSLQYQADGLAEAITSRHKQGRYRNREAGQDRGEASIITSRRGRGSTFAALR